MTEGEPAPEPILGGIHSSGADAFVLRFPLPTSLPIPLAVRAPAGIELVTWAFAGLDAEDAAGPRCLLALAATGAEARRALEAGHPVTVATHFRDVIIEPAAAEPLPPEDGPVLARALLSSATPATIGHLAGLIGLVDGVAEAMRIPKDAADIAFEDAETCTISGAGIPNYLLLRGGSDWSCARVADASLDFSGTTRTTLTLAPGWGTPVGARPAAAIGLYARGFAPLRIQAA